MGRDILDQVEIPFERDAQAINAVCVMCGEKIPVDELNRFSHLSRYGHQTQLCDECYAYQKLTRKRNYERQ